MMANFPIGILYARQGFPNLTSESKLTAVTSMFCDFNAEHNWSFSVSDQFTELPCKKMFPASGFSCEKTSKSTKIIKQSVATDLDIITSTRQNDELYVIIFNYSTPAKKQKNKTLTQQLCFQSLLLKSYLRLTGMWIRMSGCLYHCS